MAIQPGELLNYLILQNLLNPPQINDWTSKTSTKFRLKNEEPINDVKKQKSKPLNSSKK